MAFAIFPIHESSRALFESIMPLTIAAATVFFAHRYFLRVKSRFGREGAILGLVWMIINVGIDLPLMLTPSPVQMGLGEYVSDIGLTYVMIPVITAGHRRGESPGAAGHIRLIERPMIAVASWSMTHSQCDVDETPVAFYTP